MAGRRQSADAARKVRALRDLGMAHRGTDIRGPKQPIEWRRPGRGGSHVIFSADGVHEVASVPDKRPIKPIYIRHFVVLIDAAREVKNK